MNKYGAKKITVKGEKFDSKKEYNRYVELCLLERAGKISGLKRQVRYMLTPAQYDKNGVCFLRSSTYVADFVYKNQAGELVVEDVKGYKKGDAYRLFVQKKKDMYDRYQILVVET